LAPTANRFSFLFFNVPPHFHTCDNVLYHTLRENARAKDFEEAVLPLRRFSVRLLPEPLALRSNAQLSQNHDFAEA
jgi:hypothetical protein